VILKIFLLLLWKLLKLLICFSNDFGIFINNVDVRKYGSQGQQRTAALSLKLAEIELVKNYYSNDPPPNNDAFLMELHKKGDEGKNNGLEQTNKSGINNDTSFGRIESVNDIDDQKYNHNRDNNLSNYIMAIVVVLGIVALIVLVIIFS